MSRTQGSATARIRLRATPVRRPSRQYCARPDHAVSLSFATGEVVWIVSNPDLRTRLPSGSSVLQKAVIDERSSATIREKAAVLTGTGSIALPRISVIDAGGEFSNYLRLKLANDRGIRGSVITLYSVCGGENLDLIDHRLYTFLVEGRDSGNGRIDLQLSDLQRRLETRILEPKSWNLLESITKGSQLVKVSQKADEDVFVNHDDSWTRDPGRRIAYAQLSSGEVFSYNLARGDSGDITLWVHERALWGTKAKAIKVEPETEVANRPKVTEFTWIEGEGADCLHWVWGGVNREGATPLPAHWHGGVDYKWLDKLALNDEALQLRIAFANTGGVELKTFIETQIFGISGGFFRFGTDGRLINTPLPAVLPDASYEFEFNERNVDLGGVSSLKHSGKEPWNPVILHTERDPVTKKYRDVVVHADHVAEAIHGSGKPKHLKLDGFTSAFNTPRQKRRVAQRVQDAKTWPDAQISFPALAGTRIVSVGTPVRVSLPNVRDDTSEAGGEIELDRTMIVIGRSYSLFKRKLSYTCWGSTGRAAEREDALAEFHIPAEVFKRGAINLETLIPLSNKQLRGSNWVIPVGIYYIDSDVHIRSDFRCRFSNYGVKFGLRVIGELINDSPNPFDGTARSIHAGGKGERVGQPPTQGGKGFMGAGISGAGGIKLTKKWRRSDSGSSGSNQSQGFGVQQFEGLEGHRANYSVPALTLALQDGDLVGLPADLSGSGGSGGYGVTADRRIIPTNTDPGPPDYVLAVRGRDAGRGGLGMEIWHRGYQEGGKGGWVTDGGAPESLDDRENFARAAAANAAGGEAGAIIFIDDAPLNPIQKLDPSRIHASPGQGTATHLLNRDGTSNGRYAVYRTYYDSTRRPRESSLSHARVFRSPAPEKVQPVPFDTSFEAFFADQPDNQSEVRVALTKPTDGNKGDLWITPDQLKSTSLRPAVQVFVAGAGYQRVDWDTTEFGNVYRTMIAIKRAGGSLLVNRPNGQRPTHLADGDAWRNALTGEVWIWRASGKDELYVIGEYQVGDGRVPDPRFARHRAEIAQQGYGSQWNIVDELPGEMIVDAGSSGSGSTSFPLATPGGLTVHVYSSTQAEAIITHPPNAAPGTQFELRRDGALIATLTLAESSHVDNGLSPLTTYVYTVRAILNGQRSADTKPNSVTTPAGSDSTGSGNTGNSGGTLSPVTGESAQRYSPTNGQLFWTPSTDTRVDAYEVRRDGQLVSTLSGRGTNGYYAENFAPGQAYSYTVRAIDGAGNRSIEVSITMPANT